MTEEEFFDMIEKSSKSKKNRLYGKDQKRFFGLEE